MSRPSVNTPADSEFIRFVKAKLQEKGWKQADLSRATGLTSPAISRILTKGATPSINTIRLFGQALDVPTEQLLRLAGILPKTIEPSDNLKELEYHFTQLPPERQEIAMNMVKGLTPKTPVLQEAE